MSKVWTVAIWSCSLRRWVAAFTSPVQARMATIVDVLSALVPTAFVALVEVERDSVDLIEQRVSELEPVPALESYVALLEEKEFVEEEAQAVAHAAIDMLAAKPSDVH